MTKEELLLARARFSPSVGDRVTFTIPERGGWSHGFGDVVKLNRATVEVDDCKHGSGKMLVDRALLTGVIPQANLVTVKVV